MVSCGGTFKDFGRDHSVAVADLILFFEVPNVPGNFGPVNIIFMGFALDVLRWGINYFKVVLVVGFAGATVRVFGFGLRDELNKWKGYHFAFFVVILQHSLLMF